MSSRKASVERKTRETQISISLDLDGSGAARLSTGLPFFDHMLEQIARHGLIDLAIEAQGDLQVDAHHTVEDVGIVLGQALAKALGEPRGINRYGHAYVPLDEALSRAVIDFSGRPGLEFAVTWPRARVGDFDLDLFHEFFQGLCNHAHITIHMIAVVDLGTGNLHSVAKALEKVSPVGRILITSDANTIRAADRVVLPGQGAIGSWFDAVRSRDLVDVIQDVLRAKPVLGICVGMQALFDHSDEDGGVAGLGVISGNAAYRLPAPSREKTYLPCSFILRKVIDRVFNC
ncbi:MAG: hypothetical protein EBU28_07095 [Gammaproteobacteria bacterium]|nr:hypothetical protein [Gammaproteobacteria bacterium]